MQYYPPDPQQPSRYPPPGNAQWTPPQTPWSAPLPPQYPQPQGWPPAPSGPLPKPKRKIPRLVWIILGIAVVISMCSGAVQGIQKAATATPVPLTIDQPTEQPTTVVQATATPTAIPRPTAQPTAQPTAAPAGIQPVNGPARLGGQIGAFVAQYGQPNDHSSTLVFHFARYPTSNVDFLLVLSGIAEGYAYAKLAEDVRAQSPPEHWTQTQARDTCARFYPLDAVFQKRVEIQDGYDDVYYSATLAKDFPPSAFIDAQENLVTPGLFDVSFLVLTSGLVESCDMAPGTQSVR